MAALSWVVACAVHEVPKPLEEEPFVLSPGPPPVARRPFQKVDPALTPSGAGATAPVPVLEMRPSGSTPIELAGRGRRVPLVHARIAGQPTLMLVDTGAYDHLLEGWFARELQDAAASGRTDVVVDHANRKLAIDRWSEVTFGIDGFSPLGNLRPLVTGDQSPGPRAFGIGGILSPQRLARRTTVVLDFGRSEMLETDEVTATARLAAHPKSLGVALRCGAAYLLDATVDKQEARLLVDTGAHATDLKASSAPGQALAGRTSVGRDLYAVGGPVGTRQLTDAVLVIGSLTTRVDVAMVADQPMRSRCPSDGVIGMDVLTHCVVAIDELKMRVACD